MEAMKEEKFLRVSSGDGYGDGSGSGSGDGYGDGSGYGSGDGCGIKNLGNERVHEIDGVQTILRHIHGNIAKGDILQSDLTRTPCYVVRRGNTFAHGETIEKAQEALMDKLLEEMTEDERIEAFLNAVNDAPPIAGCSPSPHGEGKKYPVKFFFDWHHRLTGSCEAGRRAFARDHGIDLENGEMTLAEFLVLTKDAYGGSVIRKILER